MKQYDTFIFKDYKFLPDKGRIILNYSLDDEIEFTEKITIPTNIPFVEYNEDELVRALFALHLIGGVSYYKSCCPKNIEIRSGELSKAQAEFWNTVYTKGLGEFFFKNDIDFRGLINFPVSDSGSGSNEVAEPENRTRTPKVLIPVGGGKDSVLTIEMLRQTPFDITLLRIGAHPVINDIAMISELPLMNIEREIAPALIKMNNEGALNGHIPITAYNSFLIVVLSILYGYDAIAFSNEHSASEGNREFHGEEINHQWSKSIEAERLLQDYIGNNITKNVSYFSALRQLSELGIVQQFSRFMEYFGCTTSCNTNWRIVKQKPDELWCQDCPKCAFIFALYAAFIEPHVLTEIFGSILYDNEKLLPLYKELLGQEGYKPFECVGTKEETQVAFLLAHERGDLEDTPIMQYFVKDVLPTLGDTEALKKEVFTIREEHAIPDSFTSLIQ